MATIRSQHCEERLVFRFRIDSLNAMFNFVDESSDTAEYDTAVFGAGFFFRVSAHRDPAHGPCFDLSMHASDDFFQPLHVEVTIQGRSRDNETTWFSFQDAKSFNTTGDACQWENALSSSFVDGCAPLRRDNAVVVVAVLKLTRTAPPPVRLSADALDLLYQSIESKEPPTVRYVAFSARRGDGILTKPQSIFAPRDILVSSCEAIEQSLEEGLALLDGSLSDPESLPLWVDGDDIEGLTVFSDYESDEEDDAVASELCVAEKAWQQSSNPLLSAIDFEADITEEQIILVDGDAKAAAASSEEGSVSGTACSPAKDDVKHEDVLLRGVAHRTWQALIYYLYTGIVVFAPLSSDGKEARKSFLAEYKKSYTERPTPPSCRAMYDLAVKLGIDDLRKRAFAFLRQQLSEQNIIDELFSPFTSRHEPVRAMEVTFLVQRWNKLTEDSAFEDKLEEMARGERPYAAALVMHIFRAVAATECRTIPGSEDSEEQWNRADCDESDTSDETYSYHSSDCDETTEDDMDYEAEEPDTDTDRKVRSEAGKGTEEKETWKGAKDEEALDTRAEEEAKIGTDVEAARRVAANEEARRVAANEEARRAAANEAARRAAADEAADEVARRAVVSKAAKKAAAARGKGARRPADELARRVADELARRAADGFEEAGRATEEEVPVPEAQGGKGEKIEKTRKTATDSFPVRAWSVNIAEPVEEGGTNSAGVADDRLYY